MSTPERETQKRVINLFRNKLGYRYLGDRKDRAGNSNVQEVILSTHSSAVATVR
jgi:type I restriction enzyme, R subunit